MIRTLFIFLTLINACIAEVIGDGYLATSNGNDENRVVAFATPMPKVYFEITFLTKAPHTKNLIARASSVKFNWRLVGYYEGRAIYDLVHSIKAYGGEWAVKTILLEAEKGLFRPVFSRETQPSQWPITDTFFAFAGGRLLLVDRYRENAKLSGPYGHVIRAEKSGWIVEDFSLHPDLFLKRISRIGSP